MSTLGNILWFIFGGVYMGLGWWLAGILCAVTIVGLPWAKACFVIGQFAFFPFGKEAVSRSVLTGQEDIGTGALGMLGNVIWFLVAGVWLAIGHCLTAFACFITFIGIPFVTCPQSPYQSKFQKSGIARLTDTGIFFGFSPGIAS